MIDNFKASGFYQVFALLFLFLSIWMLVLVSKFDMGYGLNHPQFNQVHNFMHNYIDIKNNPSQWKIYTSFFWIDFVWAFSLLISLHGLITFWSYRIDGNKKVHVTNWYYISLAAIAYSLDFIENNLYLGSGIQGNHYNLLPQLIAVKEFFYGIAILYVILKITKRYGL